MSGVHVKWAQDKPATGGYEVSSAGDRRFSAMHATLPDGRTIEMWYQCDVKGYAPRGTDWRLGKGKPSLIKYPNDDLFQMYLSLWRLWAVINPNLIIELAVLARQNGNTLTDCFAYTDVNQARALAHILNTWFPDYGIKL